MPAAEPRRGRAPRIAAGMTLPGRHPARATMKGSLAAPLSTAASPRSGDPPREGCCRPRFLPTTFPPEGNHHNHQLYNSILVTDAIAINSSFCQNAWASPRRTTHPNKTTQKPHPQTPPCVQVPLRWTFHHQQRQSASCFGGGRGGRREKYQSGHDSLCALGPSVQIEVKLHGRWRLLARSEPAKCGTATKESPIIRRVTQERNQPALQLCKGMGLYLRMLGVVSKLAIVALFGSMQMNFAHCIGCAEKHCLSAGVAAAAAAPGSAMQAMAERRDRTSIGAIHFHTFYMCDESLFGGCEDVMRLRGGKAKSKNRWKYTAWLRPLL